MIAFAQLYRTLPSPILGQHEIEDNSVVTVRFRDPKYPDDYIFKAERLAGAVDPPTVLAPENRSSDYRPQIGTREKQKNHFTFIPNNCR